MCLCVAFSIGLTENHGPTDARDKARIQCADWRVRWITLRAETRNGDRVFMGGLGGSKGRGTEPK